MNVRAAAKAYASARDGGLTAAAARASTVVAALAALVVLAVPSAAADTPAAGERSAAAAALRGDFAAMRALLREGADPDAALPDGTRALHVAAYRDDVAAAAALLDAGADVAAANDFGVTPIQLAAANGNAALLALLIDAGADPNGADAVGEPVLLAAVRSGERGAVATLLDRGARVDARDAEFAQTALMIAAREGQEPIAALLIERGADVNARTRVGDPPQWRPPGAGGGSHGVGIVRGGWPERGMRPAAPGGMTALLYAARHGWLGTARRLVEAGADVNLADANGIAPLLMAIVNDRIALAEYLLARGANVNAADWYGQTPLWAAVDVRNLDVDSSTFENGVDRARALDLVRALLAAGAEPNARTKEVPPVRRWMMPLGSLSWVDFTGQTAFLRAALAGDVEVMRLLLEAGADPSIPTFGGTTALMAAAGVNWVVNQTYTEGPEALLAAVKLCHELGADVNAANSMGLRAVHGAANRGSNDIIEYLAAHGAALDAADNEGRTPLTWAEGVFLATHAPEPKPATIELLSKLLAR